MGKDGAVGWSRKEEEVITLLRLGYTEFNSTLHRIGSKHATGKCRLCDPPVDVECKRYERERRELKSALQREKVISFTVENMLQRSE